MSLAERIAEQHLARTAGFDVMALSVGETYENATWRVHRYAMAFRVEHLVNAGKKGKKCIQFSAHWPRNPDDAVSEKLGNTLEALAKRNAHANDFEKAFEEAKPAGLVTDVSWQRGVDVKPGGFQPLFIRGIHLTVKADYDGFVIEDIDDENNEPTCIAKGKKSVQQFFVWARENNKKIQVMTFHDIMNAMDSQGIAYHSYCALDLAPDHVAVQGDPEVAPEVRVRLLLGVFEDRIVVGSEVVVGTVQGGQGRLGLWGPLVPCFAGVGQTGAVPRFLHGGLVGQKQGGVEGDEVQESLVGGQGVLRAFSY